MHNIDSLARFLGILDETDEEIHDIRYDAQLVARVFIEMMRKKYANTPRNYH